VTDAYGTSLYARTANIDKPIVELVNRIAADRGVPPAQVAMAWVLRHPAVASPIVGATRPEHLEDAVAAASLSLTDEEVAGLEGLYQPHPPTDAYS
jgi:aryl-alcohol dehydrogenase-like predicted oxidoreductase